MIVWQRLFGGRSASEPVTSAAVPNALPLLPLPHTVTFPGAVLQMSLTHPSALSLIDALERDPLVLVVSLLGSSCASPGRQDFCTTGTVSRVVKVEPRDGGCSVLLHGIERREITSFLQDVPFFRVETSAVKTNDADFRGKDELTRRVRLLAMRVARRTPELGDKAEAPIASAEDAEHLTDFIIANVDIPLHEKQRVLGTLDLQARMTSACDQLSQLLERLPASPNVEGPECSEHGALALVTCLRCGAFACPTCLGTSVNASKLCGSCRRKEKTRVLVRTKRAHRLRAVSSVIGFLAVAGAISTLRSPIAPFFVFAAAAIGFAFGVGAMVSRTNTETERAPILWALALNAAAAMLQAFLVVVHRGGH